MENKFNPNYAEKMLYYVTLGTFTEDDWKDYCTEYLEYLLAEHEDVLYRLKNV